MKKYFVVTFFLFLACLIMSFNNLKAYSYHGVAGIKVKAYSIQTSLGTVVSRDSNFTPAHQYESVGTVKLDPTGAHTNIKVRVHSEDRGKNSPYRTFSDGDIQTYDSSNDAEINLPGDYTLYYKNPTFAAYRLSHSGSWRYD